MTMHIFNAIALESSSDCITMHPSPGGIRLSLPRDRRMDHWHERRVEAGGVAAQAATASEDGRRHNTLRVYDPPGGSSLRVYLSMYAA